MIGKKISISVLLTIIAVCLILVISFFAGPPAVENDSSKNISSQENSSETVISNNQAADFTEENITESKLNSSLVITEQENHETSDTAGLTTCSLSVTCTSVLANMDLLSEAKRDIIPLDGIIYYKENIVFYDNETVFDILNREMKDNQIHLEFNEVPMYNSAYIEGIGNLYEFDCGEYSGWQYRVNGIKPTYGCSQYIPKNGDKIEFYFTCDFMKEK